MNGSMSEVERACQADPPSGRSSITSTIGMYAPQGGMMGGGRRGVTCRAANDAADLNQKRPKWRQTCMNGGVNQRRNKPSGGRMMTQPVGWTDA